VFNRIDLYRPPLDPVIVGVMVAALALAVVVLYGVRHRAPVKLLLRLAAIGAIAWVLAGPSVLDRGESAGRVEVVMLADTSASMAETDTDAGVSRFDTLRATWLSPAFLRRVRDAADLRLIAFDEASRSVSDEQLAAHTPVGSQTHLFTALRATLGDAAGVPVTVLLTDGHDTRHVIDAATIAQLQRTARPIFPVPVGRAAGVADVAVQAWADADFIFEGQTVTLNATVIQTGFHGETVRVQLLQSGRVLEEQSLTFADEPAQSLRFTAAPPADPLASITLADYTLRVVAPRPQRVVENDEQTVFVQVSRDRMKIALFEGEPYWDTRYLAQAIRADPQADVAAVYRFGPRRQVRVTSGPGEDEALQIDPARITQEELNLFDVVILGRHAERLFPGERASLLVDFVRQRGGALVMARGRAFANDPVAEAIIAQIEPVTWGAGAVQRLALALTPEGAVSPLLRFDSVAPTDVILTELPGVLAATRIEREKAATMILLRQTPSGAAVSEGMVSGGGASGTSGGGMAAVAHQHVGRGQVLAVLGEGLWKWALLPTGKTAYDPVYAMFWTRAVRWLATGGDFLPGQSVSMKLDRLTVEPGEPVRVTLTTRHVDAGEFRPVLTLVPPTGEARTVALQATGDGEFSALLEPKERGVWRVELTDAGETPRIDPLTPITSRLAVVERSRERLDPAARPRVLRQLAEATGGECWPVDDPDALLRHIEQLRIARETDVSARYDFNRGWAIAVIVLALGLEWMLRRRSGLL